MRASKNGRYLNFFFRSLGSIAVIFIIFNFLFFAKNLPVEYDRGSAKSTLIDKNNSKIQNISNHSVAEAGHYLYWDVSNELNMCLESSINSLENYIISGKQVKENIVHHFDLTILSTYNKFFQLCISKQEFQHVLILSLRNKTPDSDCDVFVSSSILHPSLSNGWDWKSDGKGNDDLSLPTYLNDYQRAGKGGFFIGISGKLAVNKCSLEIQIKTIPTRDLLRKLGLRGGQQVILPRDVQSIANNMNV